MNEYPESKEMGAMARVAEAEQIETMPPLEATTSISTDNEEVDIAAVGGESLADMPDRYFRSWKFIGTVVGFVLGFQSSYFLVVMASFTLYSFINVDIGPSASAVWVLLAWNLTQTATFPLIGRLSDLFGRRYFFLLGSVISFAGLLIGSRANSINMLIAAQVVGGLGSSFQQACLSALPELVPRKYRFLAIAACVDSLAPLSMFLPVVAINICAHTEQSWRWIWYLCLIMTTLSGVLLFFCYHPPQFNQLHRHHTKVQLLRDFDWVGLVMFVGSTIVTLLGISWGGQEYPWKSRHVISTLVVGPILMIIFFLWELRIKESAQVIPLYLFKERNYVTLMLCAAVASMIWYAVNVMATQEATLLFGTSLLGSGWVACAQTVGAQVGGIFGGVLVHTAKRTKLQLIACCVIFTAMIGGLAGVTASKKAMFITFSGISSAMVGYVEVIALAGAPMSGKDKDIGVAAGVVASFRTLASSLATSIYVTVFTNKAATELPIQIVPAAINAGLPKDSIPALLEAVAQHSAAALQKVPGIGPTIMAAVAAAEKIAFQHAFSLNYLIGLAFGGCAIIAAVLSKNLDGELNNSVARKLQKLEPEIESSGAHEKNAQA